MFLPPMLTRRQFHFSSTRFQIMLTEVSEVININESQDLQEYLPSHRSICLGQSKQKRRMQQYVPVYKWGILSSGLWRFPRPPTIASSKCNRWQHQYQAVDSLQKGNQLRDSINSVYYRSHLVIKSFPVGNRQQKYIGMLLNSSSGGMRLRLSFISVNLKLKFECKIRLVVQSGIKVPYAGPQSHRHREEPALVNNAAAFSTSIQFITRSVQSQRPVVLNVYVVSARNKYKAGLCKLDVKDILLPDKLTGEMSISKKLDQCPDKEAYVSWKLEYEVLKDTSRFNGVLNKSSHITSVDEERCCSIASISDLGKFVDLQDDTRRGSNQQTISEKRKRVLKGSVEVANSGEKIKGKEKHHLLTETQKLLKRTNDLSEICKIGCGNGLATQSDWLLQRKENHSKRVSITPQKEEFMQRDFASRAIVSSRMQRRNQEMRVCEQPNCQLMHGTLILMNQIKQLELQVQQLNYKHEVKCVQVVEQLQRIKSLKENLQSQTNRCSSLELQNLQLSHKNDECKRQNKQFKQSVEAVQRRCEYKIVQYKEEVEKLSTKMLEFERENQELLFEVNKLKDQLINKDMEYQNMSKSSQAESTKNTRVTLSLNSKIQQLQAQIKILYSHQEVERMGREQLMNEIAIKDGVIESKIRQTAHLQQTITKIELKQAALKQALVSKEALISGIIKKLQEINIKNDEMKVQYNENSENQILPILQTISRSKKIQSCKSQQLTNQLGIKTQTIERCELQIERLKIVIQSKQEEFAGLSDLYEETKFRLEVQLTTVEALEQALFNSKAQLEYEKQNTKDSLFLEQRILQLKSQNSQLVARINMIQRQRMEEYSGKQDPPFSSINRRNHRMSGCSNFSDQEEIRTFINQLQFPLAGQFWEEDEILQSPIQSRREISVLSEHTQGTPHETIF